MAIKKPETKYSTILVVDDSEIDNFVNQKVLKNLNVSKRVFSHTNGKNALEYLKNLEGDKEMFKELVPEIIFLDINMPIMDGHQFIEEYSKLSSKVKVLNSIVIVTSSDDPQDVLVPEKMLKYIRQSIVKPINESNVVSVL